MAILSIAKRSLTMKTKILDDFILHITKIYRFRIMKKLFCFCVHSLLFLSVGVSHIQNLLTTIGSQ